MRKIFALLLCLFAIPAMAEIAPIYYDDAGNVYDSITGELIQAAPDADTADSAETGDNGTVANTTSNTASAPAQADIAELPPTPAAAAVTIASPRATITRGAPTATATTGTRAPASTTVSARTAVNPRGVTTRGATAPVVTATTAAATRARATTSSRATTTNPRAAQPSATTARAALVQTDTVNSPLYIPADTRVAVRSPVTVTATAVSRAPTLATIDTTTTTTTDGPSMDELAQLNDFCKSQYYACMDGFCNVLDDNQGRCSCSGNIDNYAKTEQTLADATSDLQDVATQIQYIGLSHDEVTSLFTPTDGELAMTGKTDNSQLYTDLQNIQKLVMDPSLTSSASSTSVTGSTGMLDLSNLFGDNFSFDSGFDISSLLSGTSTNIQNQRGTNLYNTASQRCKASVLANCSAQGIDTSVITSGYDLEIDRQCIAYQKTLDDSVTQMQRTVANAKTVLQKARLIVAQDKNQYDMNGCVTALDTCMQSDFACGSDYTNCVDPTGKYIVNGTIVAGSIPGSTTDAAAGTGLYSVWAGGTINPWSDNSTLTDLIALADNESVPTGSSTNFAPASKDGAILSSLLNKIGYVDANGKTIGMCSSVLNKCQNYTFTGSGNNVKFVVGNQVTKEYLTRSMQMIRAKQDEILSTYAQDCSNDLQQCLSTNSNMGGYYYSNGTNTLSATAKNACMPIATTCASVHGNSETANDLIDNVWNNMGYNNQNYMIADNSCTTAITNNNSGQTSAQLASATVPQCVAAGMKCAQGYMVMNGQCVQSCATVPNSVVNTSGAVSNNGTVRGNAIPYCACANNFKSNNGQCLCNDTLLPDSSICDTTLSGDNTEISHL